MTLDRAVCFVYERLKKNMTDKNIEATSTRRRFLSVAGVGALLALGAGAQAMRVRARQAQSVSREEVNAFSRGFAVFLDSGTSLVESFDTLAARQNNPAFRVILEQISSEVAEGATLSRVMAKFPLVFDADYIAVIQEGEYHGTLEESVFQLARRA